jgi:hypothetical protein
MIGIIFIYFIGNFFFRLAEEFKKNKWVYAILGVATYYGGGFILSLAIFLVYDLKSFDGGETFDDIPEMAWNLISIPLGLASCYGLYKILKYQWGKSGRQTDEEVLDADLMK